MKSLIKPLNRLRVVDSRRREPNWKENDEILNAAGVNDANTLQHLSSKGVDITAARNWNEASTLHIASQRGSCQVVELLLDVRAKPNAINNTKSTPLHYAASGGHQQVVKLLIDAKALISYKDKDNKTPLHLAANRGHYQVVRMLVDAGAIVDARDKNGKTPLANAVSNDHHAIVKYLITEAKADISKISKDMQQRYKSHCRSHDQVSASIQSTPSHLPATQHQQRYVQQQRHIQQQMKQVHLMQRTQQCQRSASQQQIERTSTHQQQQYRTFHLQINKQQPSSSQQHSQERQQQSEQKVQLSTQLHQLFQLEVEIEIQPSQGNEQAVQEQLVQKQAQVKKQKITKSTLTSTTSLNYQEEKVKHVETQQMQREQLSAKTSLVEGKIEQKQQKLHIQEAEEEVICTEEEVFYEEDHSRLCEIEREMNKSTSNPISDVADRQGNRKSDNDNDETCSEHDAVAIGINSTMNVIATQEVQQVTNDGQPSVQKDHTSNAVTNSLTALTGQHSPYHHSSQLLLQQQQPHPPYATQETTNGVTPVSVHNSSLQKQHPDLLPLPNFPHQQSYNYYPDYQPFYPQQGPTNTLPNHYLPAHPQPPPHHLYRHYTLPMASQYHPPFAHYYQQGLQLHPYGVEHRSSSPAVLEQSSLHHNAAPNTTHLQPVPEYPHYPYDMEHRSSSPAVLEQSSYHHTAALQIPNPTQLPGHQQFPHHTEHRSSSPAVLEQPTHHHHTPVPHINTTQCCIQPTAASHDHVITHNGLVSPQRPSPAMSTSPALTSTSPLPVTFLRQTDVNQQQLPYSNNSPNNPQHIDLQVQELTRRIEELKSQREACERTIKQDENEQLLHEGMGERRVVTPVIYVKEEEIHKHSSETTTEESPTLSTTPPQLFKSSSSENSSNQSLHSIPYNCTPTPTGSFGRITPNNLPLQRSLLESTSTNGSDTMSTVPHTVINSTTPDQLPSDTSPVTSSNAEVMSMQSNRQQQNCANQIVSNLFSNFQSPPQAGPGGVVVQMLFMQDNNIAFPSSSTQSIECGEDNHNSLKPFTTDICSAIEVNTILPFMVKNGLLSSSQHQYLLNPYHTITEKQNKLTCIAVTLSEDCVEKFLQCLEETSDYEPHETLLKKIRNGV